MRAFWFSLVLLNLLLLLIVFNFVYIRQITDELSVIGSRFAREGATAEQIQALTDQWHHYRPYLSFSVNYRELDHMEELMASLALYHNTDNTVEFRRTCILIADAASDIARLEQWSVENIF